MNAAQTTFLPDTYRFNWPEEGVEIILDRLVEQKSDLHCEMTVRTAAPFPGLLRQAKFNLSSTVTRTQWVKALGERTPEIDWYAAIEQACTLALRRWREGSPFIDLGTVEPNEDDPYLLNPYIVEGASSGVFADGGTGKSLFALAMGLSIASGENLLGPTPSRICRVLYLDWEWDHEAHAERLRALCLGYNIPVPTDVIYYRREFASIIEGAPGIRRFIAEHDIGFVIVDSLGFARGGEPESADLTIRTFAAFRSFVVPVLFVDHVSKHSTDKSHSFGSVYTRNSSRLMWRMDAEEESGGKKRLGLVNTKWNRRFHRPRGLALAIEIDDNDRLVSARFDDCEPPIATIRAGSLKDAAAAVLRQNPEGLSLDDLRTCLEAETVKVSKNVLGATLGKKANRAIFDYREGKWFASSASTVQVRNYD